VKRTLVGQRYAKALFEHVQDDPAPVAQALNLLAGVYGQSRPLQALVTNPRVSAEMKATFLREASQLEGHEIWTAFLRLVVHERRVPGLPSIADAFDEILKLKEQREWVGVVTARVLDDAEQASLTKMIEGFFATVTVHVTFKVEEELLGGMLLRLKNRQIDLSVRSRLHAMVAATLS
jgi:F-type H+-transporting ATPase subunit delta